MKDLEASRQWYERLLGETECVTPIEGILELKISNKLWLQLIRKRGDSEPTDSVLRMEVTDIQAELNRLGLLGIPTTGVEMVEGVISYFDLQDPDGNRLSFYQLY